MEFVHQIKCNARRDMLTKITRSQREIFGIARIFAKYYQIDYQS
jgi:hypothetical protein